MSSLVVAPVRAASVPAVLPARAGCLIAIDETGRSPEDRRESGRACTVDPGPVDHRPWSAPPLLPGPSSSHDTRDPGSLTLLTPSHRPLCQTSIPSSTH